MATPKKLASAIVKKVEEHIENSGKGKLYCQTFRNVALEILPLPTGTRRFLESAESELIRPFEEKQPRYLTWEHLREARRTMTDLARKKILSKCDNFNGQLEDSATALAYAQDKLEERRNYYPKSLNDSPKDSWGYCYWCWRIIPDGSSTLKRQGKCELHERGGIEYHRILRALKRAKRKEPDNHFSYHPWALTPIVEGVSRRTKEVFQEIPKSIWSGLVTGEFPPENHTVFPVTVDLPAIWSKFYFTADYVMKNGGDLEKASSILKTLQSYNSPKFIESAKATSPYKKIETIFEFMEKDFNLAYKFLFWAEVWLQFLHEDKESNPHGGKRAGAGRKKRTNTF